MLGREVEVALVQRERGESGALAAVVELKAERTIKAHGARHVMGRQSQRADTTDWRRAQEGSVRPVCFRPIFAASRACGPQPIITPSCSRLATFSGVTCSRKARPAALHAAIIR